MKFPYPILLILPLFFCASLLSDEPTGPEKWEKSIAEFEARDQKSEPPKNALLFVGSSSIRMWDLKKFWPEGEAINNGFGGSTLADSIHFFDRLIAPYEPRAVIIYAGDNDIKKGLSSEKTFADFKTLAEKIRAKFPKTQIAYIAIKPSQSRWGIWPEMNKANQLIHRECEKQENMTFVDIASPMLEGAEGAPPENWFIEDGLHLSIYGYEVWSAVIKKALAE